MTIRNANPDDLDRLADLLHASNDGGAYGRLSNIFDRARTHDVSGEVGSLQPLLHWLTDAAEQLRDGARILRQDDGDGPIYDPNAGDHAPLPGDDGSGEGSADGEEAWEFDVPHQTVADQFVDLAAQDELSEEDLASLSALIEQADKQPAFAAYLVDSMGVEEFMRLSLRVEEASVDMEGDARDDANALLRDMGNVLNAAFWIPGDLQPGTGAYEDWLANTPQGQAYAQRLDAFNGVGAQQMGSGDDSRLGFDVAFDLMGRASVPVDDQFFNETMSHLNAPYAPDSDVCVVWPEEMSQSLLLAYARTNPDGARAYLLPRPTSPELEATWAADLVAKGDDMTEVERATLAAVLQSNEDDAAFNQALLDDIGTNGLMEFSSLLAEGAHGDGSAAVRQDYARLQEGLANGIATATQDSDSEWYRSFMGSLETFGGLTYDVGFTENEVRGYQVLLNLLEEGEGYSSPFLNHLGSQLRRVDANADDEYWRNYTDAPGVDGIDMDGGELDMLALDPVNSLLGIMGDHPDAAADFLDPANGNLDYLIDRDWGTNLYTHYTGPSPIYIEPSPALPDDVSGFGDALEAATTGRPAGSDQSYARTPEGEAIMHDVVEAFSADNGALIADDGQFANLRPQLGTMSAAYIAEMQFAVSGLDIMYEENDKPASFGGLNVDYFLLQVGRDPDAYATITGANQAYTALAVEMAVNGVTVEVPSMADRVNEAVSPGATIAGIMSSARASSISDGIVASDEAFNSNLAVAQEVAGLVVEETTGRIPVFGGVVGWGANELTGNLVATLEQDHSQQAYEEGDEQWQDGRDSYSAFALDAIDQAVGDREDVSATGMHNGAISTIYDKYDLGLHWDGD